MIGKRKILKLLNGTYEDRLIGISVLCTQMNCKEVHKFFKTRTYKKNRGCFPGSTDYAIRLRGIDMQLDDVHKYYRKGKRMYISLIDTHICLDYPRLAKILMEEDYKVVEEYK